MITSLNCISTQSESDCLEHLAPMSLGASHHSGHRVPLFLASLSSASYAHHLITSHSISDLSLLDRYRDSLNPDS